MTSSVQDAMKAFLKKKEEYDAQAEKGPCGYMEQFAELRQKTLKYRDEEKYSCSAGEKPYNIRKNRYKDIIPYDYSRVKLSMLNEMPGTDYINANYINGPIHLKQYIAAQGPLPNTVRDFWRMMWEQKTNVVLMACAEYEGVPPKHRCERYWPTAADDTLTFDEISVSLENEIQTEFSDYVIREIRVECCRKVRKVYQLHYLGWPDHGVPDDVSPILDMITKSHQHQTEELVPLVVHCSAGCGRTGTLIAIDYAYSMLKSGKLNMEFDLFNIIDDIRKQRPSMVQSVDQYRFTYSAVAELFLRHLSMITQHPYENVQLIPKGKKPLNKPGKPVLPSKPGQSENVSDLPTRQKAAPLGQKPAVPGPKPKTGANPKNLVVSEKPVSLDQKRSSCVPSTPVKDMRILFSGNKPPEQNQNKKAQTNISDSYSVVTVQNTSSASQPKFTTVTDQIQEVKSKSRQNEPPEKAQKNISDSYSNFTIQNTSSGSQPKCTTVTDQIQEVKSKIRQNEPSKKGETAASSPGKCQFSAERGQSKKTEDPAFDSCLLAAIKNVSSKSRPKQLTDTEGDGYSEVIPDADSSNTSETSECISEVDGSDDEASANVDNAYAYADPMAKDKWVLQHYALQGNGDTEARNVSEGLEYEEVGNLKPGIIREYAYANLSEEEDASDEISEEEDAPDLPSKDLLLSEKKWNNKQFLKLREKTEQKFSALAQKAQLAFPKRNNRPKGPRENTKMPKTSK